MTDYGGDVAYPVRVDFIKDPDSVEDFGFAWAPELAGDTIVTSTFSLPDGLTQVSTETFDTSTVIFLRGGSAGGLYRVRNRVTTLGGRTFDKTIVIQVADE